MTGSVPRVPGGSVRATFQCCTPSPVRAWRRPTMASWESLRQWDAPPQGQSPPPSRCASPQMIGPAPAAATAGSYELTVRNGRVVTEESVQLADLGVNGGKIEAIAPAGSLAPGATDVDATGLVVAPGGVDSHAHIEQRTSNGLTPVGDWYSASVSALCGGTTTVVPFACQHRGSRISQVIEDYRELAKQSACDYAFHIIVTEPGEELVARDLHDAFSSGYSSVKVYMTYDSLKLEDEELLTILELCRTEGAMVMVHAESDGMIKWITSRLLDAELRTPKYHGVARHALAEREATHRAITFAEFVGAPLLLVHVSGQEAAAEIGRAQLERGHCVFGETCPQYLTLTAEKLKGDGTAADACGIAQAGGVCSCSFGEWEGAKYLCSPPLRSEDDVDALWEALRSGKLQVVSSDHSAYNFTLPQGAAEDSTYKLMPTKNGEDLSELSFTTVPMGLPGLETRLSLVYSAGVQAGRIDLNTFAAVCATNPAKLYGLYPRKGVIAVGSDADFAIWDPVATSIITHDVLHDSLDYTPYEGIALDGGLSITILRGNIVYRSDGDVVNCLRGQGEWIPTGRPDLLGWESTGSFTFPNSEDSVLSKAAKL